MHNAAHVEAVCSYIRSDVGTHCRSLELERHWSDTGETPERHWSDTGATLERHWSDTGATLSDTGVTLERHWSDTGATLERHRSDTGGSSGYVKKLNCNSSADNSHTEMQ